MYIFVSIWYNQYCIVVVVQVCKEACCRSHGATELQLRAAVPNLAALVGDPSGAVRDAALQLLVDVYRHVGECSTTSTTATTTHTYTSCCLLSVPYATV